MRLYLYVFLFFLQLLAVPGLAQRTFGNREDDLAQRLALVYLKINFTKEQRQALSGLELEYIFRVDSTGHGVLEDVNGLHDLVLLDSMKKAGPLPNILLPPERRKEQYSLYFLKLQYPVYSQRSLIWGSPGFRYRRLTLNDFAHLQLSGQRMDLNVGAVTSGFAGKPARHLGWGGGVYLGVSYTGAKGLGGGVQIGFYTNRLKAPFPIASPREQEKSPLTLLSFFSLHQRFARQESRYWLAHLDFGAGVQNIITRENNNDKDYVQFSGFTPGLMLSHHRQLGPLRPSHQYFGP